MVHEEKILLNQQLVEFYFWLLKVIYGLSRHLSCLIIGEEDTPYSLVGDLVQHGSIHGEGRGAIMAMLQAALTNLRQDQKVTEFLAAAHQ